MEIKQLGKVLSDNTSTKIILMLNKKEMTLTQIFNALPHLKYRDSAHSAVHKLLKAGLIKRRFDEQIHGYKYLINFKKIEISKTLEAMVEK